MNFIEIMGNLGNDPEVRTTPSGQKLATFSIATRVRKGGQDITVWYRVTVWGDRFEKMMPYIKKGTGLIVRGTLNAPETYVDKNGATQVRLEVTAEVLSFSPFGKPQSESTGANNGTMNQSASNDFSYTPSTSYNVNAFSDPSDMQPMTGQNQDAGNTQYSNHSANDNVPF